MLSAGGRLLQGMRSWVILPAPRVPWPCGSGGLALLAMTSSLAWRFLQDQVAKSAVEALTSLYGTKFKYGSIITTICK